MSEKDPNRAPSDEDFAVAEEVVEARPDATS